MERPIVLVACFAVLLHAEAAQAYVDPGTGSLIFQAAIATLLGFGVVLRRRWRVLTRRRDRSKTRPEEAAGSDGRD